MSAILGIDLGTSYCAVATLDEAGRAVTIPNHDGEMLTPSIVYLGEGNAVIGQAALDAAQEFPDQVASLVKRRMGYADYGRQIHGRAFRPETLAAVILKKLITDAAERVGPIERAVITVPAYFDDTRRKATQDAGRIAGLGSVDIFDEPCAAALSYTFGAGRDHDRDETILVYDLGGGTFDVSIVRTSRRRFQTLAIEGDVRLGGHDWDSRIVDFVAEEFIKQHGSDPRTDSKSRAQLFAAAERAKRTLSKLEHTTLTTSHGGHTLALPLSRSELENITRDLLTRTRLTVQQVLKHAGLGWNRIDRVLLVGGATHMPMTRQMLRELSGRPPESGLAVSEVVARGAALHGGILAARHNRAPDATGGLNDVVEIHVNAHSLGVEVRHQNERISDIVIPKNTQLPAGSTRVYRTVQEDQRKVRVRVLQGEARQAEACIPVGECWIDELPPGLAAHSPVEVTCGCREDGLIVVTARDPESGKSVRAELHREGGLSDAEIAWEKAWLDKLTLL
ncbi:MAG: Hsp70 family protein [Gemmataceae bacterium]